MEEMVMINIGVIGAGRIGRIHAQSIQEKELFGWECKDENVTLP